MSRYYEDDEQQMIQAQIEQEEQEYAEYIYQLQRDDELLEKANEQLRSLSHERI